MYCDNVCRYYRGVFTSIIAIERICFTMRKSIGNEAWGYSLCDVSL